MLKSFGFHEIFIRRVHLILQSAKLSILLNGTPHDYYSCGRGVRQGDLLSPLLFCIAEEVLSRGILALHNSGKITPISKPRRCPNITHVMYADDVFIFCRGDIKSLTNLMQLLEDYRFASGQITNRSKSYFYVGKSAIARKEIIKASLGFLEGSLPFNYLGVPIFKGCPKRQHLQALAIKLELVSLVGKVRFFYGRESGTCTFHLSKCSLTQLQSLSLATFSFTLFTG